MNIWELIYQDIFSKKSFSSKLKKKKNVGHFLYFYLTGLTFVLLVIYLFSESMEGQLQKQHWTSTVETNSILS